MPAAPRAGADFMLSLGYWGALQGFLTYSLGWTRHDRGLRWWYDAGKPVDDPRLALINAVWERDDTLLAYAEWCHAQLHGFGNPALAEWTAYDDRADVLSLDWQRRFRAIDGAKTDDGTSPHGKHLEAGDHTAGPADQKYDASLTITDRTARRAIYTSTAALGWYRGLVERGAQLPESKNSSWRVDVYVRSIGFLGTYRRSRQTGLWFAGRHQFHSVGN
jgi:hypothetical protein